MSAPLHSNPNPGPRHLTRRGFLAGSLGLAAGLGLAACGDGSGNVPGQNAGGGGQTATGSAARSAAGAEGYSGPAVELQFWNGFTGGDGPVMKKLVDAFMAENDNIKIVTNTMQWADYYKKLPTAVTTGKGPDVAIMHVDSVATNAARNVIQPLDDVAAALELSEADFAPVPWKAGMFRDQRFAIPLDVHPLGFFYNKDVMEDAGLDPEKPPTDAESYLSALETLKGKGTAGYWVTPFPFTASMTVQSLTWQFGGDLISPDASEVLWADDAGVKALTWYADMVKLGYSPAKQAQDADFVAMENGKSAFNWNGIWQVNTMKDLEKQKKVSWGVAALPNIGGTPAAWAGSHQFVLPVMKSPDENKSAAARVFLNWISQQSLEWAKGGQVPARNSVRESKEFAALTEQATLATQIDDLHFPPAVAGIGDAYAEFEKVLTEVIAGGKDPKTSLSDAAGRATKILQANKKKYG